MDRHQSSHPADPEMQASEAAFAEGQHQQALSNVANEFKLMKSWMVKNDYRMVKNDYPIIQIAAPYWNAIEDDLIDTIALLYPSPHNCP